jgi:hypothetical protein
MRAELGRSNVYQDNSVQEEKKLFRLRNRVFGSHLGFRKLPFLFWLDFTYMSTKVWRNSWHYTNTFLCILFLFFFNFYGIISHLYVVSAINRRRLTRSFHDPSMILPWSFHDPSMILPWSFHDPSERTKELKIFSLVELQTKCKKVESWTGRKANILKIKQLSWNVWFQKLRKFLEQKNS